MTENEGVATVQTLAAEVRVLVVGNRQITTGIARQLDVVEPGDVEPFGRVAAKAIGGSPGAYEVYVVGRSRTTGALVRARAHSATHPDAHAAWSALPLIVLASR
jgi:hypothetical protein